MSTNAIGVAMMAISLLATLLITIVPLITNTTAANNNLTASSQRQKDEVDRLQVAYDNAVHSYGELSDEAGRARSSLDEATASFEANRRTVDDLRDSIDSNRSAIASWGTKTTEALREISTNYGTISNLIDDYETLSNKTNRTAEESTRMADIARRLGTSDIPQLVHAYNAETGALDASVATMRYWVSEAQNRARYLAVEGRMTELYRDQTQAIMDLDDANAALEEAQRANIIANDETGTQQQMQIQNLAKLEQAQRDAQAAMDDANSSVDRYTNYLTSLSDSSTDAAGSTQQYTTAVLSIPRVRGGDPINRQVD